MKCKTYTEVEGLGVALTGSCKAFVALLVVVQHDLFFLYNSISITGEWDGMLASIIYWHQLCSLWCIRTQALTQQKYILGNHHVFYMFGTWHQLDTVRLVLRDAHKTPAGEISVLLVWFVFIEENYKTRPDCCFQTFLGCNTFWQFNEWISRSMTHTHTHTRVPTQSNFQLWESRRLVCTVAHSQEEKVKRVSQTPMERHSGGETITQRRGRRRERGVNTYITCSR